MSNKNSLMGLFDTFNVVDFMQPLPTFHIFVQVGLEQEGKAEIVMRIQTHEGDFNIEGPGQLDARNHNVAVGFYICNVDYGLVGFRVPRPGNYRVTFRVGSSELMGPSFLVQASSPSVVQ